MTRLTYKKYIYYFLLLIQMACIHKEFEIQEVYFKRDSLTTQKLDTKRFEHLEKCTPRKGKLFSDEIKYNEIADELSEIIEEAFKMSNQSSWYNVEIYRVGHSCTIYKGKYNEK